MPSTRPPTARSCGHAPAMAPSERDIICDNRMSRAREGEFGEMRARTGRMQERTKEAAETSLGEGLSSRRSSSRTTMPANLERSPEKSDERLTRRVTAAHAPQRRLIRATRSRATNSATFLASIPLTTSDPTPVMVTTDVDSSLTATSSPWGPVHARRTSFIFKGFKHGRGSRPRARAGGAGAARA